MLIQMSKMGRKKILLEMILKRVKRGSLIIDKETLSKPTPETIGRTIEGIFLNQQISLEALDNRVGVGLILSGGSVLSDIIAFIENDVSIVSENKELNGVVFSDLVNRDVNFLMDVEITLSSFIPNVDRAIIKRITNTHYSIDDLNAFAKSE